MAFDPSNPSVDDSEQIRARKIDRIRWHARRGLLENDLILTKFLDAQLATMATTDMALLEELLRWGDNELLDVLMERKQCDDLRLRSLVERIKAAQK